MNLKEVLEREASLTQPIRDAVAQVETRVREQLNELVLPWEGDLEEEEEEEEDK